MASTFTLIRSDDGDPAQAERLIAAFGDKTGLSSEEVDGGRIFEIDTPQEHEIDLVQTLDGIDSGWPDHLALEMPGA